MLTIVVRGSSARSTTDEKAHAEAQYIARHADGQAHPVLWVERFRPVSPIWIHDTSKGAHSALRRQLSLSPWWIAGTALGIGIGLAFSIALLGTSTHGHALPLRGLITGAGIGIAQFMLLRGVSSRAPIWALIVALGWALGWIITRAVGVDLSLQWSVFGSSGALTFQLLSALTLAWVLRGNRVVPIPTAELAS